MNTEKEFYIHVGAHKTGSTFLQKSCFPNLQDVYYVNMRNVEIIHLLKTSVFWENPLALDYNDLYSSVHNQLNGIREKKILISSESLFGNAYSGYYNNKNSTEILKNIFYPAKIIVVIRRQDNFAESLYKQSLLEYHSIPIIRFIGLNQNGEEKFNRRINVFEPGVDIPSLNWNIYIDNYINSFGIDNVLILPYEMLADDINSFLCEIYKFLSINGIYPENSIYFNKGYSNISAKMSYFLNPFIKTEKNRFGFIIQNPFNNYFFRRRDRNDLYKLLASITSKMNLNYFLKEIVDRIIKGKDSKILKPQIKDLILDYHKNSNLRLQEYVNFDLKKYGYY